MVAAGNNNTFNEKREKKLLESGTEGDDMLRH